MRVQGHGVAEGGDCGPGLRRAVEGVVGCVGEEGDVACGWKNSANTDP